MFWVFAGTSLHSFVLHLYLVNAFDAKEISKIHHYRILLNVLWLSLVGVVVAKCVGDTLWLWLLVWFFLPSLPNISLLTFVTDDSIYEIKAIACEAVFQFKSNLNAFKGVVIIYQEIVEAFTLKHSYPI